MHATCTIVLLSKNEAPIENCSHRYLKCHNSSYQHPLQLWRGQSLLILVNIFTINWILLNMPFFSLKKEKAYFYCFKYTINHRLIGWHSDSGLCSLTQWSWDQLWWYHFEYGINHVGKGLPILYALKVLKDINYCF